MEQLRHRLTNVSRNGQTCRADQNPLKRSDLDDLESPAAPSPALRVTCYNPANRHERKESERFKSYTYEELTKRDP
jgi:type I restriction enzyme M protein